GERPAVDAMVHAERERMPDAFTEVSYHAPLGAFPGWVANEGLGTWVLCVHGQSGGPRETLRIARTFADQGSRRWSCRSATTRDCRAPRVATSSSAGRSGRTSRQPSRTLARAGRPK